MTNVMAEETKLFEIGLSSAADVTFDPSTPVMDMFLPGLDYWTFSSFPSFRQEVAKNVIQPGVESINVLFLFDGVRSGTRTHTRLICHQ